MPKKQAPPQYSRPKEKATKQHLTEQNINSVVMEGVLSSIRSLPPEQILPYLAELPSPLLSVITQYIPKQKDTNEGLQASHISLIKSYEHLPSVDDLATRCHVLASELQVAHAEIKRQAFFMKHLSERKLPKKDRDGSRYHHIERRMYALLKQVQHDALLYMERAQEQMVPLKQWKKHLSDAITKDRLITLDKERLGGGLGAGIVSPDDISTPPPTQQSTNPEPESPNFELDKRSQTDEREQVPDSQSTNYNPWG